MTVAARAAVAATVGSLWVAVAMGHCFALRWPMLTCLAFSFVPYAAMMSCWRGENTRRTVLVVVSLASLPFVASGALLSDDVYRHLFEGRVVLAGANPFSTSPLDPSLAQLRNEAWTHINHKSIPTIYPVLLQALFAALALFNTVFAFKFFALLVHLATVWFLHGYASARAAWLFGLNPLLIVEGPLSGHHDGFLGLLLLLSVLGLQGTRWRGVVFAACAASLKLVGFAALLTFARRRTKHVIVASAVATAFVGPSFFLAGEQVAGTTHFAHRWQGNEGAYVWVERAVEVALAEAGVRRHVRFAKPRGVPELFDPTATFEGLYRGAIQRGDLARVVARAVVLCIVVLFALWIGRRTGPGRALVCVLWLSLLLSPQLHPWYWMWVLPVSCLLSRSGALIAAPLLLAGYSGHDAWQLAREATPSLGWIHPLLWAIFAFELPPSRILLQQAWSALRAKQ